MVKAESADRNIVVDILAQSFDSNKSFNAIVKQDEKRVLRIRKIFEYYFDICSEYGHVYLTKDKKGCTMILFPDTKRNTINGLLRDIRLGLGLGLKSIKMGFERESKIKSAHPLTNMYYLLFIGVYPEFQNQGIGSNLLKDIINDAKRLNRPIYLETYLDTNIKLYKKFGFTIYNELYFGFPVYCMQHENVMS